MTFPAFSLYPTEANFPDGPLDASLPLDDGIAVSINGQQLTGTDANGVLWHVFSPLVGWDGSPASSRTQAQRLRAAGAWSGPRNSGPRLITLTGQIEAPNAYLLALACDALSAAVSFQDTILTITRTWPGSGRDTRSAIVARQDEILIADVTDTVATFSVSLSCDDPRRFGAALTTMTTLPSTIGGLYFPWSFPFTFDTVVTSGLAPLTNVGNAVGPVLFGIDGPIKNPSVTHLQTGLTFGMTYEVLDGEKLVVDVEAQTALSQGTASRNQYITSRGWPGFVPGLNEWSFAGESGSGVLTVAATPAWL